MRSVTAGPTQKYVCSGDDSQPFVIPPTIAITLYDRHEIACLSEHTHFTNALSFSTSSSRPDMLAAVAVCNQRIVGIAGASADCDTMWQIGVDVLPDYQRLGIGKALVGTLTKAILQKDMIPYYTTSLSHLRSRQLAVSLGFWPAWVHLYARDR